MEDSSPWKVFARELRGHMTGELGGRRWTSAELAAELAVSPETVQNWRKGRVRPALELLPRIGRVLEMGADAALNMAWDPLYLPRLMGLLGDAAPDGKAVIEYTLTAQKINSRVTAAQEVAGRLGMASGASLVAQRACELGTWAVGVWPAVEGPRGFELHVADRLTFMRTDQLKIKPGEVWSDFQDVLTTTHALRSMATVGPRVMSFENGREAYWSIPRVGVTRSSERKMLWHDLRCVSVVALTTQSWANDMASHLADFLGYGQTSTREIAVQVTGQAKGPESRQWRRRAHGHLLDARPERRTWSHFDHDGPLEEGVEPGPGLRVVYVWEADDVLRSSTLVPDVVSLSSLIEQRELMTSIATATPRTHVVRMDPRPFNDRTARWEQVCRATGDVLNWLAQQHLVDLAQVEAELRMRDGSNSERAARALKVLGWLRNQGWEAEPRHSSSHSS